MSTITSLYGSPNPSMASRDPVGMNRDVIDDNVGLEPSGSRAEDSYQAPPSIGLDATSLSLQYSASSTLESVDVAKLVGIPPPPPKSSPPRKSRRNKVKAKNTATMISSFDDDSMMYSTGSTTAISANHEMHQLEEVAKTFDPQKIEASGSDDSLKVDTPPRPLERSSIVEERVRAALATYESKELVLDVEHQSPSKDARPAMDSIENKQTSPALKVDAKTEVSVPSKPPMESPKSKAPVSPAKNPSSPKRDESKPGTDNDEEVEDDSPEPRPDPTDEAPNKMVSVSEQPTKSRGRKQKGEKQKRGFFKKLFGGKNKNRNDSAKGLEPDADAGVPAEAPETAGSPPTEKQSEAAPEQSSLPFDEPSKPQLPTAELDIGSGANGLSKIFAQDPPNEAYSETSIEDHDVLPEINTKTVTRDQNGFFFAQDEVSALSGGSKSFDQSTVLTSGPEEPTGEALNRPSTRAQDGGPLAEPGAKNVDPYTAPFFGGDTIDGPLPTPANLAHLRVQVDGPSQDPAGASPMKWDATGKPANVTKFQDPVGESPVHAWEAQKTPSSEEEKKEELDTQSETKSDVPFDVIEAGQKANLKTVLTASTSAIKAHVDGIPTPKGSESGTRVGSIPVLPKPQKSVGSEKPLNVETDAEKAGFKSATSTPVAGGEKTLNVAAAALTNAKAVAYLHRLHGEPSPRHTWHSAKRTKPAPSPVAVQPKKKSSGKKKASVQQAGRKPSPDDYSANNFDESQVAPEEIAPTLPALQSKEGAMFSAYNSKFHGRKPSKKKDPKPPTPTGRRISVGSEGGHPFLAPSPRPKIDLSQIPLRPGMITEMAVTRGVMLRRSKRDDDIANGRSERVVLTPKVKTEGRNRFNFFPADESEIKDPIQRAGRRLLSKSAIPIQCVARRYIAKRAAVERMWALIVIQSYIRRWRAETNLQATVHSAVLIQKTFRGWLERDRMKEMHYCATQVQKVVRSYLAQARVYDTMYYIVRLQAFMRGCYERKKYAEWRQLSNEKAIPIQAAYRGYKARQDYGVALESTVAIQSAWRSYSARLAYQFEIVDIIIVQSIMRRWAACRKAENLKNLELFAPASIIQAQWRGWLARRLKERHLAALKIQTSWRGFQCYTDYIFALVDVLVVQRTARRWLAMRLATRLREEKASTKIQTTWRRHKAQKDLVYSMVHIIVAQSVVRRFLTKRVYNEALQERKRLDVAATAIQKVWRGFWGFSHFIIVQYEITRLQAAVRGKLARQNYNLKLGCAIIIQATMRRHLAKNAVAGKIMSAATTAAAALELRERNAAKKIQFWWRIVLDWTKEKQAALTIERFFIHVREEVDREILRRERRKMIKKEKRRQKRRESDGKMQERVWLKTVDEDTTLGGTRGTRSKSTPRQRHSLTLPHHVPTPRHGSIGQEVDINGWPIQRVDSIASRSSIPPTEAVRMAASEDHSEVSNITNPSVFHRMPRQDSQVRQSKERTSTEGYIRKYNGSSGNKTAPNRMTKGEPQHFFSEEASIGSRKHRSGTPTSQRRSSSGTPRSQSHGYGPSTTPRGTYGMHSNSRTPRSHIQQVPSPRIAVGFPPVTPRSSKAHRQHISRRDTAETESQTTFSQSFSRASPRSHHDGHVITEGSPVMVMKHHPNFSHTRSIDEAQEVMYLGHEYGEV